VAKRLYVVNLIKYNATGQYQPSDNKQIKLFKDELSQQGVEVVERFRLGQGIEAACGQLVGKDSI